MVGHPQTPLHLLDGAVLLRRGVAVPSGLLRRRDRERPAGLRADSVIGLTGARVAISAIAPLRGGPVGILALSAGFSGIIAAGPVMGQRRRGARPHHARRRRLRRGAMATGGQRDLRRYRHADGRRALARPMERAGRRVPD